VAFAIGTDEQLYGWSTLGGKQSVVGGRRQVIASNLSFVGLAHERGDASSSLELPVARCVVPL
jgi:hypothetical protein